MSSPRIAIIYLCYNNLRHLHDVVKGWEQQTFPKDQTRIYLVPNGSPDGIAEHIRKDVLPRSGKDLPELVLIDDGVNRGFAGGNNYAAMQAIEDGFTYVFLQNGDLKTEAKMLEQLVDVCEQDDAIGAAQPLVCYWPDPKKINTSGGMVHVAGYGYARDNGAQVKDRSFEAVEEVAYVTGAAALYRAHALKEVGLLEEAFFMYHEDLELGLRLQIAGWKNVLVSQARAFHDYAFARNPKKFQWMELYRYLVFFSTLKIQTLFVLLPLLLPVEMASWLFALKGGWLKGKVWSVVQWFRFSTWQTLIRMKVRARRLRRISDRQLMQSMTSVITDQEEMSKLVQKVGNPLMKWIWHRVYWLIRW
jgi:GT2 family glycosyltransferase